MQSKKNEITQERVAEGLIWPLWRSVSDDYKKKYPRDIWDQFENAVRSASYTDSLKVFLNNFKRKLPADVDAKHTTDVLSVVCCGQDDVILNWLRTETTYLVMIVRVKNQERKEAIKLERGIL